MECRKIKRLLPLFLDGQLSKRHSAKVKVHLGRCLLCSKDVASLKETWDLLAEWKPVHPSPNFIAKFWQRVAEEETSLERQPIFVFPRLSLRLTPAFATLGVILIIGIYLMSSFLSPNIQHLAILTKTEDIQMLQELDLAEEFEIIQGINILEDFEIINSIELS